MVSTRSSTGKSIFMKMDPLYDVSEKKIFTSTGHMSVITKPEIFNYLAERII